MLADLFMTIGKGVAEQLTYWCHTYLPLNRWRKPTDDAIAAITQAAGQYGITPASVDRRRAYQLARMLVPNRRGDHLADVAPDAYNAFSPTSCAKSHSGKKKIAGPDERRAQFLRHPQTLAYLLTPSTLARAGIGTSAPGTILGVAVDEAAPPASVIAGNLREQGGGAGRAVDELAAVVAKLHAGPLVEEEESEAA